MDPFCPMCEAHIGIGTFEAVGCPICDANPSDLEEEDDDDDTFGEVE